MSTEHRGVYFTFLAPLSKVSVYATDDICSLEVHLWLIRANLLMTSIAASLFFHNMYDSVEVGCQIQSENLGSKSVVQAHLTKRPSAIGHLSSFFPSIFLVLIYIYFINKLYIFIIPSSSIKKKPEYFASLFHFNYITRCFITSNPMALLHISSCVLINNSVD